MADEIREMTQVTEPLIAGGINVNLQQDGVAKGSSRTLNIDKLKSVEIDENGVANIKLGDNMPLSENIESVLLGDGAGGWRVSTLDDLRSLLKIGGLSAGTYIFSDAPLSDMPAYCVPMNGGSYHRDTFPDWYDKFIQSKRKFITMAEWQAQYDEKGVVGNWAVDTDTEMMRAPLFNEAYLRHGMYEDKLGLYLDDAFQGHWHQTYINASQSAGNGYAKDAYDQPPNTKQASTRTREAMTDGVNGDPRIAEETRPKTIYCNVYQVVYNDAVPVSVADASALLSAMNTKLNLDASNLPVNMSLVDEWFFDEATLSYRISLKGGVLIQGGMVSGNSAVTVNLPVEYNSVRFIPFIQCGGSAGNSYIPSRNEATQTTKSFVLGAGSGNVTERYWLTIGKRKQT